MEQDRKGRCPAVILAAGYSSRMGAFKPLLALGDGTVISHLIKNVMQAGCSPVVVVTGHNKEALEAALGAAEIPAGQVLLTAYNESYPAGMFSSVKTGLRYLKESLPAMCGGGAAAPDGCLLFPVDSPLASAASIAAVADAARSACEEGHAERFAVPTYRGKKGHPLYIPRAYWEEILEADGSLKTVTDRYNKDMLRIPVEDEGVVVDMDTMDAYEEVCDLLAHGYSSLQELAVGRRFIFVRHGQIRQHAEKIFLGQTDVPLSDLGRQQAAQAAAVLTEMDIKATRIYTSPLLRARQTAEIIAGSIAERSGQTKTADELLCEVADLQEMSLGGWDGKPIRAVREQYPEAFEERGNDLFGFKTAGAENFYDLQYRAVHALKKILREDPAEDILIVTHRGVIRSLENSLGGSSVEGPWEDLPPGGIRVFG